MQSSRDAQGFALPTVINPTDSVCIPLLIPNDPAYIEAVIGALYDTTLWISWQRDAANTAIQAAAVMKKAWNNAVAGIGACPVNPQFRQPDTCTLQVSFDSGVTWTSIFNAETCAIEAAVGVVAGDILAGKLIGALQPGGQGGGATGQCYDYDVQLNGNGTYVFPVAVDTGT